MYTDTMNISPYPLMYCHFCDSLILYNYYDNGIHHAYCNNKHSSCMHFIYSAVNGKVDIHEFAISDNICSFHNISKKHLQGQTSYTNRLTYKTANKEFKSVENFLEVDSSTILNRDKSIALLDKIQKSLLLLG